MNGKSCLTTLLISLCCLTLASPRAKAGTIVGAANFKGAKPAVPMIVMSGDKKTIDQRGCTYHPHVFGMMANQQLEILNSDPLLHNIHALPKNSPQFNMAQPKQGAKNVKTFTSPEVMVKFKCDVHSWMSAYAGVLDHPFYSVTDDKGSFEIKNLPAGEYDIEAWHEVYGAQTMHVTVGAADTKTVNFTFTDK